MNRARRNRERHRRAWRQAYLGCEDFRALPRWLRKTLTRERERVPTGDVFLVDPDLLAQLDAEGQTLEEYLDEAEADAVRCESCNGSGVTREGECTCFQAAPCSSCGESKLCEACDGKGSL